MNKTPGELLAELIKSGSDEKQNLSEQFQKATIESFAEEGVDIDLKVSGPLFDEEPDE